MTPPKKVPARPTRARGRGRYDRSKAKSERKGEQEDRLLAAATRVFVTKGYAEASVEDIVVKAKMSRRTFYEHFADLRDVLAHVHDRAVNTAFRAVEMRVREAPDPEGKLRAGVIAFLEVLSENAPLARIIFREGRAAGREFEARREAALARFVALLFEGIGDAHARGLASRPPDELTLFALVSAMEAVAMRYVERREEARALEAAPAMIELIMRAFR